LTLFVRAASLHVKMAKKIDIDELENEKPKTALDDEDINLLKTYVREFFPIFLVILNHALL
jgi:hypothetical protein